MWPSEATATWLYDTANIALIVALVTGAVATALIVWMGNVKEEYLKKELAQTTERAANANERAAQLENDAAQARLEQEQLKTKLAWRRVTSEQHDKIVAMLRGHPMTVALVYSNEPESMLFANDVSKTLKDSGINVVGTMAIGTELIFGLRISKMKPPHSADWLLLVSAFSNADLAFNLAESAEGLKIIIGSKPPPF